MPAPTPTDRRELRTLDSNVRAAAEAAMTAGGGLLRLAPVWVPRSFLQPGRRLKLHPDDTYAFGLDRGGIDERWFGSTTEAANEGREPDEGLSYVVHDGSRFLLRDVVAELGAAVVGESIWSTYGRWPVYSKFFDNMGPIPHHLHQNDEQAALAGREGKPEAYYFPPQHNPVGNNFPHTFMGLEPGTTREQVRRCIAEWHLGDNRILELSKAYKLQVGTGWLIPPCVLHAPGSLCTYEPQWGSDVFGMYQNLVEGRAVPRSLLVKDMPADRHDDVEFILDQIDWSRNLDPNFKDHHYLEPIVHTHDEAHADRWIVYGTVAGRQRFSAKELSVRPGATVVVEDPGASSMIVVQGRGRGNGLTLESPSLIRFHELTLDEVFVTDAAARAGVRIENTSDTEDLVILRYFGPDAHDALPEVGDHRRVERS